MTAPVLAGSGPTGPTPLPVRERAPVVLPRLRTARGPGRLLLAVLVLYALALQIVLGGMAMAAALGPDHVLCLADGGAHGSAPDKTHLPAHGHLTCCTFCHAAGPAALPAPEPDAVTRRPIRVAAPGTRPGRLAMPRAPPRRGLGARAPPVV